MKYINFSELRAKLGNRSRSAIYLDLTARRLPDPFKIGGRLYWDEDEVDEHLRKLRQQKPIRIRRRPGALSPLDN